MRLIDEMIAEHELIERVLDSFRAYVQRRVESTADIRHAAAYGRFFRSYAGDFHHAREEDVLFLALVEHADLPKDRGPIAAISAQHVAMAAVLTRLLALLEGPLADEAARTEAQALAVEHSHALWRHIDAENSVLFPESGERLQRAGVTELDGRGPTPEEEAARREGEALLELFAPIDDNEVVRGEGCAVCPSYGVDCNGLEAEWWTEAEWEEPVHP